MTTTRTTTTSATATDPFPIRRSSRRGNRNNQQQPKKKQRNTFKVGDTVEFITDNNEPDSSITLAIGRLVSKVKQHNDSTAMTDRCWIVKTLGQNENDNIQILESAVLGHVEVDPTTAVHSYSSCDSPTSTINANVNEATATKNQSMKATTSSRKRVVTNTTASNSAALGNAKVSTTSPTTILSSHDDIPLKKRKVVTFASTTSTFSSSDDDDDTATSGGTPVGTELSKSNRARKKLAAASARAERSRRRQAIHEEQEHLQPFDFQNHPHHYHLPGKKILKKRGGKEPAIRHPSRKLLPSVDRNNVIKVPMLTGTLYLYQGTHRRAEFVRRV